MVLFVSVSVALHLALILAMVLMPRFRPSRRIDLPAAINVQMVSLPGPARKPRPAAVKKSAPKPKAEKPPVPKPEPRKAVPIPEKKPEPPKPEPKPEPKKAISLAPKKTAKKKFKPKKSLKHKTFKKKKAIQETIRRLKKKVKNTDSQRVKKALDRIRKKVDQTGPVDQLKRKMAGQTSGPVGGVGGTRKTIEMMDIYRAEIPYRIQENWAFPSQLAGEIGHIEAVIVIKIMPSGEVADIWFEKRSGNQYLDDSAYKAVKKSSPLPPLPPGYHQAFYNLGLIFTPEGVK